MKNYYSEKDVEEIEKIAIELDRNPELLKVMTAAATLTPDDLGKVVQFVNERRRSD